MTSSPLRTVTANATLKRSLALKTPYEYPTTNAPDWYTNKCAPPANVQINPKTAGLYPWA